MLNVSMRLRSLKLIIFAVLGVQTVVFIGLCIHNHEQYMSYVRSAIGLSPEENLTIEAFLLSYEEYCVTNLFPKPTNVKQLGIDWPRTSLPLCPCVSDSLCKFHTFVL